MVKDNHFLGEFELTGITPALRGVATIDVTFDIDANGILIVSAFDKSTGNYNNITINNYLSKKIIDRTLNFKKCKPEDEKQKDRIAAMRSLENYCKKIRSSWNDEKLKYKLTKFDKDAIEEKCKEIFSWLDANLQSEEEEFKDKQKELEAFYNPFITKL